MTTLEREKVKLQVSPPLGQWLSGIGLSVLAVVAVLVGLAPVLVLARRPWLWVLTVAATAALAVVHWLRNRSSFSGVPAWLRLPVTFVAAIYPSALVSLILLFFNWVLSWLFRGVGALMGFLGWQLVAKPAALAFYVTLGLGLMLAFPFLILSIQKVAEGLKPAPEGAAWPKPKRELMLGVAIWFVVLAGFMGWELLRHGPSPTFFVLLEVLIVIVTTLFYGKVTREEAYSAGEAAGTVKGLFETAGFKVDSFADPRRGGLLANLDLVATKGDRQIAVEIKTAAGQGAKVNWEAAAALGMTRWALARDRQVTPEGIEPLLVLVDTRADETLQEASEREGVRVCTVSSSDLKQVMSNASGGRSEKTRDRLISALTAGGGI